MAVVMLLMVVVLLESSVLLRVQVEVRAEAVTVDLYITSTKKDKI